MRDDMTESIIGAAIEVHQILGPGLLESIYEEALCCEFKYRKIPFNRQVPVNVKYKGQIIKGQRLDLIVADDVVVELKSLRHVPEFATAQVLSYLRATGLTRALLLNFGAPRLVDGIKRFILSQ